MNTQDTCQILLRENFKTASGITCQKCGWFPARLVHGEFVLTDYGDVVPPSYVEKVKPDPTVSKMDTKK